MTLEAGREKSIKSQWLQMSEAVMSYSNWCCFIGPPGVHHKKKIQGTGPRTKTAKHTALISSALGAFSQTLGKKVELGSETRVEYSEKSK